MPAVITTTSLMLILTTAVQGQRATDTSRNDWLIVPGVRVGPITADFSETDLKAFFGSNVVIRDSVYWFEGQYRPGAVLFPTDSTRRLAIVWKDQERRSHPTQIQLEGSQSRWRTAEGITLGTTLEELERLNERAFRITSSCCDYAGLVWSWEGGALDAKLEFVELRLRPLIDTDQHHPYSDEPAARAAKPSVGLLNVYFP